MRITSTTNPRIKAISRLRDGHRRREQGLTLIDGLRELRRALDRPEHARNIREVYCVPELCETPDHRTVLEQARDSGIARFDVAPHVFERIAYGDRNEGLVAVFSVPRVELDGWREPPREIVLVLESVEKPGNIGAVLRTADAVGAAVALADPHTDLYNPNAVRASLGAVFHVPACETRGDVLLEWLRERRFRIVAARVDATCAYWTCDLTGRIAILLGSESRGLSEIWRIPSISEVRVPMLGVVDSLNVSVTAAVLAYESVRQRSISR